LHSRIAGVPEVVGAFVGGEGVEELADGCHNASTERAAAWRKSALSLAKASSIGSRSGKSGGRSRSVAPAAAIAARTPATLVGAEIVHHHDVARGQRRRQAALDVGEEDLAIHRPVDHDWRRDANIHGIQ
jgi:hypothetical protein